MLNDTLYICHGELKSNEHAGRSSPKYLTFSWLLKQFLYFFARKSKISKSLKKQGKTSDILDYLRNYKET